MSMSKGMRALSILSKCIKAPIKALGRARDFYVNSLTGCSGRAQQAQVVGLGRGMVSRSQSNAFYRSATSSGENDARELVRAASNRSLGLSSARPMKIAGVGPRSQSVAIVRIERIDEEEDCSEFGEDSKIGSLPRSHSCGVVSKGVIA
ncbi:uncharacterized protein [Typha angustifolia]|uniref:uncharacterized protein n=1 Tax=Typha angustifolia TaxID=59011 RepID=UPI003C30549E